SLLPPSDTASSPPPPHPLSLHDALPISFNLPRHASFPPARIPDNYSDTLANGRRRYALAYSAITSIAFTFALTSSFIRSILRLVPSIFLSVSSIRPPTSSLVCGLRALA